jgi:hypothetical protein
LKNSPAAPSRLWDPANLETAANAEAVAGPRVVVEYVPPHAFGVRAGCMAALQELSSRTPEHSSFGVDTPRRPSTIMDERAGLTAVEAKQLKVLRDQFEAEGEIAGEAWAAFKEGWLKPKGREVPEWDVAVAVFAARWTGYRSDGA